MIIVFLLALTILLESTILTLPLTLLLVLFSAIIFRNNYIFALAFFAGLFLDIFAMRSIGWSSAIFVTLVFAVFLYQKKFEIDSLRFILILAFIGTFSYLIIFGIRQPILQAFIATLIIFISFIAYKKTNKKVLKYA